MQDSLTQQDYVESSSDTTTNLSSARTQIRGGFEDFIRVNFNETGFMSSAEVSEQRNYVDSVLNNPDSTQSQIKDLLSAYTGSFAERSKSENLRVYYGDLVAPLKNAMEGGAISASSYREWINWIRDPNRRAKEKKQSIAHELPTYLNKRRLLANKRQSILSDSRLADMANSSDPKLKSMAAKMTDNDYFLDTLSFSEREKLIVDVLNALPLAIDELKLFEGFAAELETAQKEGLINGTSVKKWIARFKNPGVNLQAKTYFVTQQFPSYMSNWRRVAATRKELLQDPIVQEMTPKDMKGIAELKDGAKFTALHFDKRENLIAEAKAAIKAKKTGKEVLLKETKQVVEAAAAAGYISSNKIGAWTQHVIDGKRTLSELKQFAKDWAKVRFRFDKVSMRMTEGKVPQGLQRLSVESFLALSYQQRLSYVESTEQRLQIEESQPEDTPIQDMKGKVRHALDTSNWEEAKLFLAKAWPLAETQEDIAELQSMEKYLRAYGTTDEEEAKDPTLSEEEQANQEVAHANSELMRLLNLLPVGLQSIYRKALAKGADCVQCMTTTIYNRTWCEERDYLNEPMEERLREQSIQETADRLSAAGPGHGHGAQNAYVDGFHQPAIRDSGIGPQNVFLSPAGADAFVEKCNANKNTWSYWYWTNAIVDGVSASQNAYAAYSLNHQFKRHARTLERHGKLFNPVGPLPSMN